MPDPGDVARTLAAVGEPSLRRLFFGGLENPEWLEPLAALGTFADPGVDISDAGRSALPWPEGDYLRRVAPERPVRVRSLLQEVVGSENPWVQRAVVDIAAELPVDDLVVLVPGIARLVASGPDRVDVLKSAWLIERLLDEGKPRDAKKLLNAMFGPTSSEAGRPQGSFGRIATSIDEYWYREVLGRLASRVAALGMEGLKLVVGWLMRAIEIRDGGLGELSLGLWRPFIAAHAQNGGSYGVEDVLIDAARDIGIEVARGSAGREAVDFLCGLNNVLIRRIGVEVAACASDGGNAEVAAVADELLLDRSVLGWDLRPEYTRLALARAPHLTTAQRQDWAVLIRGGSWLPPADRLREMAAWPDGDVSAVGTDEIQLQGRVLTYRLLKDFSQVLTGELAEAFAQLETEFGDLADSDIPSPYPGPNSLLTPDELAGLTDAELFSYLAGWAPQLPPGNFSANALARTIESAATANPQRFEALGAGLRDMDPVYIRRVISGWVQAARKGYRPSDEAWAALALLTNQEPGKAEGNPGSPGISLVWRDLHRTLVDLLQAVIDEDSSLVQLDHCWTVLKPMLDHRDPDSASEANLLDGNMDPLTISLNTVRPAALRAAFHLLTKLSEIDSSEAADRRQDVVSQLSLHAGPARDPSLGVAAVFGENLGRAWNDDESWTATTTEMLAAALTSSDESERTWADVAASVALRVYSPGLAVMRMLRLVLESVTSQPYAELTHREGWTGQRSTAQSAATHVITTIAQGVIQLDDPLVEGLFRGAVSITDIAEAIGHLGWQLMRLAGEEAHRDVLGELAVRARELVDFRVAAARQGTAQYGELSHFHWWIRSGIFDIAWWLPIVAEITEHGISLEKVFIGQQLARAAQTDPATAIVVLRRLTESTDYWQRYDLLQNSASIISLALKSGDDDAVSEARSLLDTVAREGNFPLLDEVDRLESRS